MANEAVLVDRIADPINFGCADIAMEKGTIVCLSGARDVKPTSADNDIVIGITAREKIAGDGRLSVPVFVQGVFRCHSDSTIGIGTPVVISGANTIKALTTLDDEKGYVLGRALEAAGSAADDIEVLLGHGGA
ncbi:MAG: capsid cement protein [Candidatus Heimdallarchaeaceae archaeon]